MERIWHGGTLAAAVVEPPSLATCDSGLAAFLKDLCCFRLALTGRGES